MKVLVTGTSGQLSFDVINELTKRGHDAIGADLTEGNFNFKTIVLDITDKDAVEKNYFKYLSRRCNPLCCLD